MSEICQNFAWNQAGFLDKCSSTKCQILMCHNLPEICQKLSESLSSMVSNSVRNVWETMSDIQRYMHQTTIWRIRQKFSMFLTWTLCMCASTYSSYFTAGLEAQPKYQLWLWTIYLERMALRYLFGPLPQWSSWGPRHHRYIFPMPEFPYAALDCTSKKHNLISNSQTPFSILVKLPCHKAWRKHHMLHIWSPWLWAWKKRVLFQCLVLRSCKARIGHTTSWPHFRNFKNLVSGTIIQLGSFQRGMPKTEQSSCGRDIYIYAGELVLVPRFSLSRARNSTTSRARNSTTSWVDHFRTTKIGFLRIFVTYFGAN